MHEPGTVQAQAEEVPIVSAKPVCEHYGVRRLW